ncbi:AMP-binding protein [Phycicoccus sp. BSK3Z-2]|uniref:acetate--CoA ligase n=1 Tax=Phycicoccus avicenniae TaxID=2828860 RepID=A0A941I1Z6_9MICO|nr:AMP-binding protein [Phycicoccus avicenniae]MBR7744816.1 AMP-binding protein [Phycicoccus avicenniae]
MTAAARPARAGSGTATWFPSDAVVAGSRLADLCRRAGVPDRAALDVWAREDPVRFWDLVTSWMGLRWTREPDVTVVGLDRPEAARWYPGGRFSLVDNTLQRWAEDGRGCRPALVWAGEDGAVGRMDRATLLAESARVAAGLRTAGVAVGDRVGVQLAMTPEVAVVQLALAWVGAVAVPVFSGFGASAVADRLRLAEARALVVADGVVRRGRVRDLRGQTAEVLAEVASLDLCVTVPVPVPGREPPDRLPHEVTWAELRALGDGADPGPSSHPADHPLMVAFTSGTTGRPKGITLGTAGFCVKAGSDAALLLDVGAGDVVGWVTDPGWVMHPITLLGGLLAGATVALVDGAPDHPHPARLWETVDALGVTVLGVSPTLVRGLAACGGEPRAVPGSLRVLASSGEPWTEDAYAWLFERVGGGRLPVVNYSGGTEVSGAILSNTVTEPIEPCAFAGPVPGMGAALADTGGNPVVSGPGELVLTCASPGMPLGFWGEPGRYERTYWADWPGRWRHGDWAEVTEGGPWLIHGRSDDTLKIAGKRIGPAEVENVANAVDGVLESAAVGVPDPVKGSALVVFARTALDTEPDPVREAVLTAVGARLGRALTPSAVHVVEDLPRTRSGKILRRLVLDAYLGRAVDADQPSLANPGALDAVRGPR